METQYRITKNGNAALWTGTLSDCLYRIAHSLNSHDTAHIATVNQAIAAGYSIAKVKA